MECLSIVPKCLSIVLEYLSVGRGPPADRCLPPTVMGRGAAMARECPEKSPALASAPAPAPTPARAPAPAPAPDTAEVVMGRGAAMVKEGPERP
jgi:hypothetical protein